MIRYIPSVDNSPYNTYVGCYRVSPAPVSVTQNSMGMNPKCPVSLCNQCSGSNCNCNMNHMRAPFKRRFWKYLWNQY